MGLLNLREISKILAGMDPETVASLTADLKRATDLTGALFAYLDAHDERERLGKLATGESSLHEFDLAAEAEEATLEKIREIARAVRPASVKS